MKKTVLTLAWITLSIAFFALQFDNVAVTVWDNDGALQYNSGNGLKGYEEEMLNALNALGFSKANANLTVSRSLPELNKTSVLVIICGHREADELIFGDSDIRQLKKFMDKGGCLYIEGNNVVEYLEMHYPEFLHQYFNATLAGNSDTYAGIARIFVNNDANIADTAEFTYPAMQDPDLYVDEIGIYDSNPGHGVTETLLLASTENKLYKSAASAYSPPDMKSAGIFRTIIQSAAFGAMSSTDSEPGAGNELRIQYMRDILGFFGVGRFMIVCDADDDSKGLEKLLKEARIDYSVEKILPDACPLFSDMKRFRAVILADTMLYSSLINSPDACIYGYYGGDAILYDGQKTDLHNMLNPDFAVNTFSKTAYAIDVRETDNDLYINIITESIYCQVEILLDNAVIYNAVSSGCIIIGKDSGLYTVTVSDSSGLLCSAQYKVTEYQPAVMYSEGALIFNNDNNRGSVSLIDISGRNIATVFLNNGTNIINADNIGSGIYFVRGLNYNNDKVCILK